MNQHDATEQAYKRGYEAGKRDAVKHGEWDAKEDLVRSYLNGCTEIFYECSVCRSASAFKSPHCPNCGAKMVGERKDNEQD